MGAMMAYPGASIESVVTRIADSLDRNVLPHIDSHYARLQLKAAREMLLNLGTRVQWRPADIEDSAAQIRSALRSLSPSDESPQPTDLTSLRARLADYIGRLYELDPQDSRRKEGLEAVWRVIRFDFETQAQRTRTGMYSKRQESV
jgi:hypothetical protein